MAKSTKKNKPPSLSRREPKPKKLLKPKKLMKPKKLRKPEKRVAVARDAAELPRPPPPLAIGPAAAVLDRLW
jgi:hypothetical protein